MGEWIEQLLSQNHEKETADKAEKSFPIDSF